MSDENHRAVKHFRECGKFFKHNWRKMAKWAVENSDKSWPSWCLLPWECWEDIRTKREMSEFSNEYLRASILFEFLGTWRLSKGIYRMPKDFSTELLKTPITGDVPVEVLKRLPEWCVYLELEGLLESDDFKDVKGAWVRLGHHMRTGKSTLYTVLDRDSVMGPVPYRYELGPGSVADMVEKSLSSQMETMGAIMDGIEDAGRPVDREWQMKAFESELPRAHMEMLTTILKVLLYICSEEPEVTDREEPEASPSLPRRELVGPRSMFRSAERTRLWIVGEELGKTIQKQRQECLDSDRKRTRRHLRRAHWHGYWLGPRNSEERRFTYKWISPTIVGL